MVDMKVCNAATSCTSSMSCYICKETSKSFNDLNKSFTENPEALHFGLSTLHARIRIFETIVHLSYKLPIEKWQAKTTSEKQMVADRKKMIQKEFKEKLGLKVDIPKAGSGNSNDGNTARVFFKNVDMVSAITGVNKELIRRLKTILEVLTCSSDVDADKFESYAKKTAELYVQLYRWYPMSPTMHKILIHGATVIRHAILPIGQLSEEAAEARNKHYREYRQNFSRKSSRTACNEDVLYRLLLTSDPILALMRSCPKKKRSEMSQEAYDMLVKDAKCNEDTDSEHEDETDDED